MTDYKGPERRSGLTDEQLEHIAEMAAEKALQKVYAQVGQGIMQKAAWVIGAAIIGLLFWMGGKGIPLK